MVVIDKGEIEMRKNVLKKMTAGVLTGAMLFSLVACGAGSADSKDGNAAGKTELTGAFLGQIDAWPAYQASMDGTAEKYGVGLTMNLFDSGAPAIETVPAHQWQVADLGSTPSLMGVLRHDVKIVGVASDEAPANAVVARADDKVFGVKGANKEFPDIYGNKDLIKGKTFLCTTVSSGHYALSKYLEALGLKDSDVTIKNLEQAQAIKAFESGEGDYLVLWTPFLYRAFEKGWKEVANGSQVGAYCLMLYLADPEYATTGEDGISRFLAMNNDLQDKYNKEAKTLTPDIKKFFVDFAAMEMSDEDINLDIDTHKIYNVSEQLDLLKSGKLEQMLADNASFFVAQNKFSPEELQTLKDKHFNIDPKFLEAAQKVQPAQ